MVVSRHGLHGKISNDQGTAGHLSFISGDKWYISWEGNKEIRTTREGLMSCWNVGKKGLIFVVYILSASQLITIDKKGWWVFQLWKEQRGVTSVNKYWTTGTVLGKIHPGWVNTGKGENRGTVRSEWRTYHEFSRRRNLIGTARKHFRELTDKAGWRMTPPGRNLRKGMTEPWSSGFPKRKWGQAPPNSVHPGYFKDWVCKTVTWSV